MSVSIPSGWREVELRDLLAESDERVGPRSDLPLLSVTKYDGAVLAKDRFSRVLASKDLSRYRVAPRDAVVIDPMLLWDGVIALQHRFAEGVVSPDYRVFRFTSDTDPAFFDYLAHAGAMRRQYARAARGTNVRRRRISRDDFLAIRVVVPPLGEQRQIAATLMAVDEAIAAGKAVVQHLREVRQVLVEALVAPSGNSIVLRGETRSPPSAWHEVRLGDVLTGIDAGWSPACEPDAAGANEWGVLKVSCASWGEFLPGENKRLPRKLEPRPELQVRPGDLLMSRANTKDLVGRAVLVRETPPRLLLSDKLLRLSVKPDAAAPAFINLVLASKRVRELIEDSATGSSKSMKNISQDAVRALPVTLPPVAVQEEIASAVEVVDARIRVEEGVVEQRRTAQRALQGELLSGRLRVRDAA